MNKLSNQVSPYLLQHKNNPVHWQPWGEEALLQATIEDKPILVSIGYAACHWCHVMEHECFENSEVAEIMNTYFVNIKVDREERPDIDQIYMESIHQMGLSGGWPLNVFLMPDQKPFYGGTYFPKQKWIQILQSIKEAYQNHKLELQKSADGFRDSLNENYLEDSDLRKFDESGFQSELLKNILNSTDPYFGGINKAPKFPMPTLWNFLEQTLSFGDDNNQIREVIDLSLSKMANGGIFDHVEGGFSRYSVDSEWFCPHFEKMLYDNGQLLSTYAIAYKRSENPLYKEVIEKTIQFHTQKMLGPNGLYFASMDADSEGIEGKFYVWNFDEVNDILPYTLNSTFYHDFSITKVGNWENGNNILYKKKQFLSKDYFNELNELKKIRSKRIEPAIDHKQILAWNAIYLIGLIDVYAVLLNEQNKIQIESLFCSIEKELKVNSVWLHQSTYTNQPIVAFLDDLSFLCLAYLKWYLLTNDSYYLQQSNAILHIIVTEFYNEETGVFVFSNQLENKLIANLPEIIDSVIPSSNSVVVECLLYVGNLNDSVKFTIIGNSVLKKIFSKAIQNPTYFSNWWRIMFEFKKIGKIFIKVINSPLSINEIKKLINITSRKPIVFKEELNQNKKEQFIVCHNENCFAPVYTIEKLNELLIKLI
ncbi:MAG: hypothetical protein RJA76_15 [Bacteroidota bacterium]|jgi:uncharacterized protein YyaL (SSP411 family)